MDTVMSVAQANLVTPRILLLFPRPTSNMRRHSRSYVAHVYSHDEAAYQPDGPVRHIELANGQLRIDGLPIFKPQITEDLISWHQHTPGHFSSGQLYFAHGNTVLHGVLHRGSNPDNAVAHTVAATSIPTVPYETQITKTRHPAGTDPGSLPAAQWQAGLTLGMTFTVAGEGGIPTPKILFNGTEVSGGEAVFSIDQTSAATLLTLDLDSAICDLDPSKEFYLTGEIAFDYQTQLTPTFTGTVESTCADGSGSGVYLWKGAARAPALVQGHPHAESMARPIHVTPDQVMAATQLSVLELINLVPNQDVSKVADQLLNENMKWAISKSADEQGWNAQFFGEIAPVLPTERQALINNSLPWYQNSFAKAYLGWSIANYDGPNAPSVRLSDDQRLKLKNYLQTGMAKDADFNKQQNGIFLTAFVQTQPRLRDYLSDGGEKWAKKLFDAMTDPAQFVLMVSRIAGAGADPKKMIPANNIATLLSALQSSGVLAKNYYEAVTSGVFEKLSRQTVWDRDTVMPWLPQFLQTFADRIATAPESIPDEARIAGQQLKTLIEQTHGGAIAVAEEMFNFVAAAPGRTTLTQAMNFEPQFADKYPRLAKAGNCMFVAAWAYGVFNIASAVKDWKNLTPDQRTRVIVSLVDMSAQAVIMVPEVLLGIKNLGTAAYTKFVAYCGSAPAQADIIRSFRSAEEGDFLELGEVENLQNMINVEERSISAEGTTWSKVFPIASKLVKVVVTVCAAYFAVRSTMDFMDEIKSGKATMTKKALDGVMMAANIGVSLCLIGELMGATSAFFPVAGAILAIVGIVVVLVEMFALKPPNPLDDFMRDTVIPFVVGLPPQDSPPAVVASARLVAA